MKYHSNLWDKYKKVEREIRAEFKRERQRCLRFWRRELLQAPWRPSLWSPILPSSSSLAWWVSNIRIILGSKIIDTKLTNQNTGSSLFVFAHGSYPHLHLLCHSFPIQVSPPSVFPPFLSIVMSSQWPFSHHHLSQEQVDPLRPLLQVIQQLCWLFSLLKRG